MTTKMWYKIDENDNQKLQFKFDENGICNLELSGKDFTCIITRTTTLRHSELKKKHFLK